MTKQDIFSKICSLLEPFNTHHIAITDTTEIAVDLGMDSVAIMDFIMEVEDGFDMDIPLHTLSEMKTVGELVALVAASKEV